MKKYLIVLSLPGLIACASSNKVRHIDTEIDVKGSAQNGLIGLKDGVAVIQEVRPVDHELRSLKWNNNALEDKLLSNNVAIQRCRADMADPRLGGSGEAIETIQHDQIREPDQIREQIGLVDEQLQIVREQDLVEHLKRERRYEKALESAIRDSKRARESCEIRMRFARVKAGLPAERRQGRVKISPEGNVEQVLVQHENNLDDAFEAE